LIYTGVQIIRIEYDMKGKIFSANIAAKNYDQAVKYLASLVKQPFHVTSTGAMGKLDLITPEIEAFVIKNYESKKEKKSGNVDPNPDAPRAPKRSIRKKDAGE